MREVWSGDLGLVVAFTTTRRETTFGSFAKRTQRRNTRVLRIVGLYSLLAFVSSGCMLMAQARSMVFPASMQPNHRDFELSVSAALVPAFAVGFRDPRTAAMCLREVLQPPQPVSCSAAPPPPAPQIDRLFGFGQCLTRASLTPTCTETAATRWCHCYVTHVLPLFTTSATPPASAVRCDLACPSMSALPTLGQVVQSALGSMTPHCVQLDERDRSLALLAMADFGELLFAYQSTLLTNRSVLIEAVRCGAIASLRQALTLVENDPASARTNCPAGACTERARYPSLALSGGAANGAFTAGYLHALLRLRELAIAAGPNPHVIEDDERFGGASGTSVGALLAAIVDLYFSPRGSQAAPQRSALDRLVDDFTRLNEWNLLCVEPSDVAALAGVPVTNSAIVSNVMRFDPLRHEIIEPFYDQWGDVVLANDFGRVTMAVDLVQNVVVGADERACRAYASRDVQRNCFAASVHASIVEPVLAARVDRIFSGLRAAGEQGFWYDGGLRSGTPSLRALLMTDGYSFRPPVPGADDPIHVLAISTNPAEGVPRNPGALRNALDVVFGTLGSFADQTRRWELQYTDEYAVQRADRLRTLRGSTPLGAGIGALFSVFIPEDGNANLMVDGYTFSPVSMLGQFLLGERTMLFHASRVLNGLGWHQTYANVSASAGSGTPSIWQQQLDDWIQREYLFELLYNDAARMRSYRRDREAAFDACMTSCGQSARTAAICRLPYWNQQLEPMRPHNPL